MLKQEESSLAASDLHSACRPGNHLAFCLIQRSQSRRIIYHNTLIINDLESFQSLRHESCIKGLHAGRCPLGSSSRSSQTPTYTSMKLLLLMTAAIPVITVCSCSTTTVVKPEPTVMSETNIRRSSTTTSSYGSPMPTTTSSTETRTITAE